MRCIRNQVRTRTVLVQYSIQVYDCNEYFVINVSVVSVRL